MKRRRVQALEHDEFASQATTRVQSWPPTSLLGNTNPYNQTVNRTIFTDPVWFSDIRPSRHFDLARDQARELHDSRAVMQSREVGEGVVRRPYVGLPRSARPNGLGEPNGQTPLIHHWTEEPEPEFTTGDRNSFISPEY